MHNETRLWKVQVKVIYAAESSNRDEILELIDVMLGPWEEEI